jgi:hypothetical protein
MGLTAHEKQAVIGKYKPRYQKATQKTKQALPDEFTRLTGYHRKTAVRLPVLEFHSDNGSKFINNAAELWHHNRCRPFTRSRNRKKNNNCFVEQKTARLSVTESVTAGSRGLRNMPSRPQSMSPQFPS